MRLLRPTLVGWLAAAAASSLAGAADLAGRISLVQKGAPVADRSLDLRAAVVFFEPDVKEGAKPEAKSPGKPAAKPDGKSAGDAKNPPPPPPPTFEMVTVRKEFSPRVLVIPVGGTVRFPNQDPILHNVFSVSGENRFDLGLVGGKKGKAVTFKEAGLVRVFCNVHHSMFSYIYVTSAPYWTQPDADGKFVLKGIPDGPGRLWVWHERGDLQSQRLNIPSRTPLSVDIEMTRPQIPPHKNKFGQSYQGGPGYE